MESRPKKLIDNSQYRAFEWAMSEKNMWNDDQFHRQLEKYNWKSQGILFYPKQIGKNENMWK